MCNVSGIIFTVCNIEEMEVKHKTILELGAYDFNGAVRPVIQRLKPSKYIGVDIKKGPGVDIVCKVEQIVERFGENKFDVVIATELLEHVMDWRIAISNIKNVCKPGGVIIITTRSKGFKYHGYPYDFWRYELEDIKRMFSDCKIISLEKDKEAPGVFVKILKKNNFIETALDDVCLYSIILGKRVKNVSFSDMKNIFFKMMIFKVRLKQLIADFGKKMLSNI